ncbi:hypothetical protein HHI36_024194 [Cryptolaemus montrouzieri]|uniref:Reverse transcriptase domain-containing protein n=1 Tax=Cryptolaemus montrouzieri TaxID=559131 RepID=A0ABD2NDQ1_9CUCU
MSKLEAISITGPLLSWLGSFLYGRVQIVKYKNFYSREIHVTSGVPQGSHLGPLLFNIFINDIKEFISTRFLSFADDVKLYSVVKHSRDSMNLQSQIDSFLLWVEINVLKLNIDKCKLITFHKYRTPNYYNYILGSNNIKRVAYVQNLNITLDSQLNFKEHILASSSKALKQLGFVLRHSREFSPGTLKLLYCSLVRSILEYDSVIWSPFYPGDIEFLEKIQRKFLRHFAFRSLIWSLNLDLDLVRNMFNLDYLAHRRQVFDLCFLYRLLNGSVECPDLLSMVELNIPARPTRHTPILRVRMHRNNYANNFFLYRTIKLANTRWVWIFVTCNVRVIILGYLDVNSFVC